MWTPDNYAWTPNGYVYTAGYWDYPYVRRGTLFPPVFFGNPIYQNPEMEYSIPIPLEFWKVCALVRKDGSRNTIAAGNRMRQWCGEHGFDMRETPSGKPELSADACAEIGDPILELYAEYSQLTKVASNDLVFLERGTREPIHCRYNVLLETGRTSSSSPNLQNLRRLPGIREAFVPPPGHSFVIADFGGLELATLAEACIALVGYSRLAEALNAGREPHLEVAARLLNRSEMSRNQSRKDPLEVSCGPKFGTTRRLGELA